MGFSALIYDCEIVKAILGKGESQEHGIVYCNGWKDFAGMGIAVICAWDLLDQRPRIFLEDNFYEFELLASQRDHIIGFNSLDFDDRLCGAHSINVQTTYDLLQDVRLGSGQPKTYVYGETRPGYSLDALAKANFGFEKPSGQLAPIMWQRGLCGAVIDYCMNDVMIVRRLIATKVIKDPTNGAQIELRPPY